MTTGARDAVLPDIPLSRDEVDVVAERGVVFGEVLCGRVLPRAVGFEWISVRYGNNPEQRETQRQHQVRAHLKKKRIIGNNFPQIYF